MTDITFFRSIKACFFFVSFFLFSSCNNSRLYERYFEIDSYGWSTKDSINFQFEITDNPQDTLYQILIGIRHNNEYLYSNIFFFLHIETPDGLHKIDTLQYLLAEPNGRWLGSGVGEIKFNHLVYKDEYSMKGGFYNINIVHGMRDSILLGIEDIGLRVEKSN